MITKTQFIESVMREISIVKHLAEKVTPENINYKPTEKQRTTRELLGYLAFGPKTALLVIKSGDMSLFGTSATDQASVTMENFSEMMDKFSNIYGRLQQGSVEWGGSIEYVAGIDSTVGSLAYKGGWAGIAGAAWVVVGLGVG